MVALTFFIGFSAKASAQLTTKLKPDTVIAFDNYVQVLEQRMLKHLDKGGHFLWVDENPAYRERVLEGDILVQELKNADLKVPSGTIHEWLGVMFIPSVKLDDVIALLKDYNLHANIYPEVIESELLEHYGNTYKSRLKLLKKNVLTVVLNTEHEASFFMPSTQHCYIRSRSTKIAQVKNNGSAAETEMPIGEDGGFLWRLNAYWRLEQIPEGVFAELVTLSLSRHVPASLGWMIRPLIRNIPRESLTSTLKATRAAILN